MIISVAIIMMIMMLKYADVQGEANDIMGWAAERGLTGTNFVWESFHKLDIANCAKL